MTGRCEECGLDLDAVSAVDAAERIRAFPRKYVAALTRFTPNEDPDTVLRSRPAPASWSAIEYAAHVRDVFALFERRLVALLEGGDGVELEVIDHEREVEEGGYRQLDPVTVGTEIRQAAEALADRLDSVAPEAWERWGLRDGERRSVADLAARAVHEGHHHLLDIGRARRAARP